VKGQAIDLKAGALLAATETHTQRSIVFPLFADQAGAHYDGTAGQLFAEAGYRLPYRMSAFANLAGLSGLEASYEPFLQAALIRIDQDRFAETALSAGLTAAAKTYDLGTTTLGLRSEYKLAAAPGFALRTLVGWRHAFGDVSPSVTESFAGSLASFPVAGVPIDRDALVSDISLDYSLTSAATLGLSYALQIGHRATDNALKAKAEISF